jgi:D-alanyl-D-alanine carboxypeptidase
MRPRSLVAALLALSLASVLASAAAARPVTETRTPDLKADLDALVAEGVPGAILFVRGSQRTVRAASGLADLAESRSMRPNDRFRIASLTKSYTATVVLQLVGEGKLRLGDSVERWLPGLVPNGAAVTVNHLLSHTSGLFDFEHDPRVIEPYLAGNFGHYWSPRQLVEMAVSHEPLFPPGETASAVYSSTNYVIAGLIVEAVTGSTIGAELDRRIFRRLGLRNTSYPTTPEISWLAVHAGDRRRGIGRALIDAISDRCRGEGDRILLVKTLSDREDPGPEYAETRAFYLALGFVPVVEMPDLDPDNPIQLLALPL